MNSRNFIFSFRGRVGRPGFWLYNAIAVPLVLLLAVAFWIYALSVPGAYENGGPIPLPGGLLGIAGAILFVAILVVTIFAGAAVTVKRLHDRSRAWWWILVFVVAPDALLGLAQYLPDNEAASESALFAIQFAALALAAWGSIELGFLRGTAGPNRFGPDPLPPKNRHPGLVER
jgi:uncharacterized membrane protein YhaH (DUF805 family)